MVERRSELIEGVVMRFVSDITKRSLKQIGRWDSTCVVESGKRAVLASFKY